MIASTPAPSSGKFSHANNAQYIMALLLMPQCHLVGGFLECHIPILKNDFFKNHLESFPDCENVFCT